jgi:hypothetical protein
MGQLLFAYGTFAYSGFEDEQVVEELYYRRGEQSRALSFMDGLPNNHIFSKH